MNTTPVTNKYLFGPIQSRRLGLSLGIDLIPYKTCSLDCIYCECGATTSSSVAIKEYVPTAEVIRELDGYLLNKPTLDVITFSGAGEPTMASNLGLIIDYIKLNHPQYKVVVLTNGTLLGDITIQRNLKEADLVIPSLDAVSQSVFLEINKPHHELNADGVVQGMISFSRVYTGKLWIEIFIIPGINDSSSELDKILEVIKQIQPTKIQLNTLDRPGVVKTLTKATYKELTNIAKLFSTHYPVEIINGRTNTIKVPRSGNTPQN